MREKPRISDEQLAERVGAAYGLTIRDVAFLAGGADADAAAYRITCDDGPLFLKLRWRPSPAAELTAYLAGIGSTGVIAPRPALDGGLTASLDQLVATVSPFVEGRNGFDSALTEDQWVALGAALRVVHGAPLTDRLRAAIRTEDYAATWRDKVRAHLRAPRPRAADRVARAFWNDLVAHQEQLAIVVDRAERLAEVGRAKGTPLVICHGDLHAGNVIVGSDGRLSIVDWDDPLLAPKERDLMFVGAGVGGVWNRAEELDAFRRGYRPATVDPDLIAYYRYERIAVDTALFADQVLLSDDDGVDRWVSLTHFRSQFDPDNVVQMADQTYATLAPVSKT